MRIRNYLRLNDKQNGIEYCSKRWNLSEYIWISANENDSTINFTLDDEKRDFHRVDRENSFIESSEAIDLPANCLAKGIAPNLGELSFRLYHVRKCIFPSLSRRPTMQSGRSGPKIYLLPVPYASRLANDVNLQSTENLETGFRATPLPLFRLDFSKQTNLCVYSSKIPRGFCFVRKQRYFY